MGSLGRLFRGQTMSRLLVAGNHMRQTWTRPMSNKSTSDMVDKDENMPEAMALSQIKSSTSTDLSTPMGKRINPFPTPVFKQSGFQSFTSGFATVIQPRWVADLNSPFTVRKDRFLSISPGGDIPVRQYTCCTEDGTSNKPDPVTQLTPKMVKLLKCLAAVVKADSHTHSVNIFKKVFEADRLIQLAFPKFACDDSCALDKNEDFHKQVVIRLRAVKVDVFMKSFIYLLDNAGSVPDLKATLALLNRTHTSLHIAPKHFLTFGGAVNDYLKQTLGAKYSEDVECAVAYFWKFVVSEMTAEPGKQKCCTCGAIILKPAPKAKDC